MKIKNLAKTAAALTIGAAMSFSTFAFVGCGGSEGNEEEKPPIVLEDVTVKITVDKTEIHCGTNETVTASVAVDGLEDKSVTWSVEGNGASLVEFKDGVLSLKNGVTTSVDKVVKLTATSNVTSLKKDSVTITIKAQIVEGQVGELKTEMFTALGNPQITVSGEVSDIYDDFNNDNNDVTKTYDFTVKMADGAWYGEWNAKGATDKDINNYRRSENVIANSDEHTFDQVYINKDNEVAQKAVTDYNSVASVWENQHLWNHLAQLGTDIVNQWEYDAENEVYLYKFDNSSEDDLYLRAYLSVSLTPMLEGQDTLETIGLKVADGKITQMIASTTVTYYGASEEGTSKDATAMSYTTLTADFTGVGATEVPTPTPYEAPRNAEYLERALEKMGDATNYTFRAVETTVSAPPIDEGEYADYSLKKSRTSASNSTSSTGTVGLVGQVTQDAILLARTGKYTSGMDDNLYWTNYSGYKQLSADKYDFFEYSNDLGALQGKQQFEGNVFDNMPKFDFSANIFQYAGMSDVQIGGEWIGVYNFTLREPAITRDLAMQVSAHTWAKSAKGSTYGTFKISVLETGEVVSTEFPYDITLGTYTGVIKTTYSKIGTTVLPEDTFEGYEARVLRENWSQFNVRYYYPTHTTNSIPVEIDGGTLLNNIYGDKANTLPSPTAFFKAFGDSMTDLFFEWDEEDNTATGGGIKYFDYVSFNLSIEESDENGKITTAQHDACIAKLTEELAKDGYAISATNTGETYWGDRYTTYISENGKGKIMIKVHNNRTRFFFVDILPVGLWTLNSENVTG